MGHYFFLLGLSAILSLLSICSGYFRGAALCAFKVVYVIRYSYHRLFRHRAAGKAGAQSIRQPIISSIILRHLDAA